MIYLSHIHTACTEHSDVIDDCHYPQRVHWFPETYDRAKTGMSYPPHVLANMVLKKEMIETIKDSPVKTAFILAAGSQCWADIKSKYPYNESHRLFYQTKLPMVCLTNIYSGRVASMFGVMEYVSTDASACASSIKVLMDAQNLMRNYGFQRVIILGVEDSVNNSTLDFFGQAKASLLLKDEDSIKPSAFDSVNAGFNIGQGAVCAVLETEDALTSYPIARFLGAYTAAEDNSNPLGQRPDGAGYRKAIEGAMFAANVKPDDIKIIKTHGTGTPTNNAAEKSAITGLFNDFVATSYKQRIGHTLCASGLMETGLILDDIKRGIIPAIANRTERDDKFLSQECEAPDGHVLSLAAGMGNVFSAAIFSREA